MKGITQVSMFVVFAAGCGAATPPTAADDNSDAQASKPEAEDEKHAHRGMHPSWDKDNDGINDCESDGSCDHTVDYSKPRKTR